MGRIVVGSVKINGVVETYTSEIKYDNGSEYELRNAKEIARAKFKNKHPKSKARLTYTVLGSI